MSFDLSKVSKAIAGAVTAGGLTAVAGTVFVTVPESVQMPWWGYVLVGVANAALTFAIVYAAPRNTQ